MKIQKYLEKIFEDYKVENNYSVAYYLIFFFRRYILIFTLVGISNYIKIICAIHVHASLFMSGYVLLCKPFYMMVRNFQEAMNELSILVCVYTMILYTDFLYPNREGFDGDLQ